MNTFIGGVLFCGILVMVVLWRFSGRSNPNNKMLALSLFFVCYSLLINHFIFTGYLVEVPHLARTAVLAGNLIFPFLYVYIRNSFYPGKLWKKIDWWLLAPSIFYIVDLFPFFILSGEEKAKMIPAIFGNIQSRWRMDQGQGWLCPFWLHFFILYGMGTFFWVIIVKMILRNQQMEGDRISKTNKPLFNMLVMLTASYFILTVPGLVGTLLNVWWFNSYFMAFSISIPLFVVAIFLAFSPQILYGFVYRQAPLQTDPQQQQTPLPENALLEVKQEMGKIFADTIAPIKHYDAAEKLEMEALFLKIDQFMHENRPFTKQSLSIHELSAEIGIPVYSLSKVINMVKGVNFNKWLNQYRIAYFILLYQNPDNQQLTLEALAQKAGFISRITFIKNFKQEMGDTPAQYIKTYFKKDLV
jgi:AraC-like DNA-binding protein